MGDTYAYLRSASPKTVLGGALLLWAALVLLFAVVTPFLPDAQRGRFFLAGMGCLAGLVAWGCGMLLLPRKLRILGFALMWLWGAAASSLIALVCWRVRLGTASIDGSLALMTPALYSAYALAGVLAALSLAGWAGYVRARRRRSP